MLLCDAFFLGVKSSEVQNLKNLASKIPGTKVKATKLDSSDDRKFRIVVEASSGYALRGKGSELTSGNNFKSNISRIIDWKSILNKYVSIPGVVLTVLQKDGAACIATITGPESAFNEVKSRLKRPPTATSRVEIKSVSLEEGPSETYKVEVIFPSTITTFQIENFKSEIAQVFGRPRFYIATNASAKKLSIPAS